MCIYKYVILKNPLSPIVMMYASTAPADDSFRNGRGPAPPERAVSPGASRRSPRPRPGRFLGLDRW